MSDFEFEMPTARYDEDVANEGIELAVVNEAGGYYGTFKITLADDSNQRHRAKRNRYFKTSATRTRSMTPLQKLVDEFVELDLVGWQDVKGKGGKDVPFSKEAAKRYFNSEGAYFALEFLYAAARNVMNFQGDKEEEAGN